MGKRRKRQRGTINQAQEEEVVYTPEVGVGFSTDRVA